MQTQIDIENMSHLADGFIPESQGHFAQQGRRTEVVLIFRIPGVRYVSVKIPRYTPIYRVRNLVRYLEQELTSIYGSAKRVNYVFVRPEDSDTWGTEDQLPMHNIVYV